MSETSVKKLKRINHILNVRRDIRTVGGKVDDVSKKVDEIIRNQRDVNQDIVTNYDAEKKKVTQLEERYSHQKQYIDSLKLELETERETRTQHEEELSNQKEQRLISNEQLSNIKEKCVSLEAERDMLKSEVKTKDATIQTLAQQLISITENTQETSRLNECYKQIMSHYLPGLTIDSICDMSKTSKGTGQLLEQIIYNMCVDNGKRFEYDVENVSKRKESGDISIHFKNDIREMNVLIEIKCAALSTKNKSPVSPTDIEKFYRDISNKQHQFGLLIYHISRRVPGTHIGDTITNNLRKSKQNTHAYFTEFDANQFDATILQFFCEAAYTRGHEVGRREEAERTMFLEKSLQKSYETDISVCNVLTEQTEILNRERKRKKREHSDFIC